MCSSLYSMPRMENYQGDLTDIVRAGSTTTTGASGYGGGVVSDSWQFPSDPMNFSSSTSSAMEEPCYNFGDPFSHLRDPLLHELCLPGSGFFTSPRSSEMISNNSAAMVDEAVSSTIGFAHHVCGNSGLLPHHHHQNSTVVDDDTKRPIPPPAPMTCNIFSRMLQISPSSTKLTAPQCDSPASIAAAAAAANSNINNSPIGIKATSAALVSSDMINVNSSKGCLLDNTGMQISSPRNPGIKRRKSQAKKVVCIPAPAAANSRPSGEVVPSDLWAWRKYGQKPIKGSPYPRGYYRCSSSKGCSARKQVERSRTDPNMLVITYTSEHNHPWPTQRNALAGSTRTQPSKSNASNSKSSTSSNQLHKTTTSPKEEQKDRINENNYNNASPIVTTTAGSTSTTSASVKEEIDQDIEKQVVDTDDGEFSTEGLFPYRPSMAPESIPTSHPHHDQDFFADLGEIEADPLNLLFSQGFAADHGQKGSKGLDPFSLFDWSGDNNSSSNSNSNSFGDQHQAHKRDL